MSFMSSLKINWLKNIKVQYFKHYLSFKIFFLVFFKILFFFTFMNIPHSSPLFKPLFCYQLNINFYFSHTLFKIVSIFAPHFSIVKTFSFSFVYLPNLVIGFNTYTSCYSTWSLLILKRFIHNEMSMRCFLFIYF